MRTFYRVLGLLFYGLTVGAAPTESHLNYKLPEHVVKRGPLGDQDSRVNTYHYFVPGYEWNFSDAIGVEYYINGVLWKWVLRKDRRLHGVQRAWYPNGLLESEEPYRDGEMDGLFKYWNEAGQLIGAYRMIDGAGRTRIYDAAGHIVRDVTLKNGKGVDPSVEFLDSNWHFNWMHERSRHVGVVLSHAGAVVRIVELLNLPSNTGYDLVFDGRGKYSNAMWQLKGRVVGEEEYASAAEADPTLPQHLKDEVAYREWALAKTAVLYAEYKALAPVKIPIELDAAGNPKPAVPAK